MKETFSTVRHGIPQVFVRGHVPKGSHGESLVYGSDPHSVKALPRETRRTDPLGQNTQQSTYQRAHHLQNFHNSGYETSTTATNNDPFCHDHRKKQHFVRGVIPGGSTSNKMIFGTEELLRQSEEKKRVAKANKPDGFLYGTEAATNVGKQKATTKPNNALWIEARVHDDHVTRHQKMANDQDEFLYLHQRERERQKMEREQEKRRDFEMLQSYKPWGRPGNGAPNAGYDPNKCDVAKRTNAVRKLTEEDYNPLGRGGGGAPNRTVSGKQQTKFCADPELRFPKYGENSDVPPSLRYGGKKDKQYAKELETFMEEVRQEKELKRQESIQQELRHIEQNPYNKPGGGAPMKDEQGNKKSRFPLTLSKNMEELRAVEPRHQHAYSDPGKSKPDEYEWLDPCGNKGDWPPWGKGYHGIVERDKNGKIIKTTRPKNYDQDGLEISTRRPGAGAPNRDSEGNIITRKPQTLSKDNYGQTVSRDFSPKGRGSSGYLNSFGKQQGAGAPIRDADGKVKTHLTAQVEHDGRKSSPNTSFNDVKAKQAYLQTLQELKEQADCKRKAENEDLKQSGGDVVSWLKRGVVGQPKFDPVTKEIIAPHKTTSDVTQQRLNIRRQKNDGSSSYHDELSRHATENQRKKDQEKINDVQDCEKHLETMNNKYWGKGTGNGAALEGYRKQKCGLDPVDDLRFRPT